MSSVFLWGNTRMLLKKLIEERDIIKSVLRQIWW